MARLKGKNISIVAKLRNYFITGIVVSVPIGITLYLTKFFISVSSKLIPPEINPNNYLPFFIPGLEIVLAIIFITLIGYLSLSFIGKKILQLFNDLLKKIPILRTIYSALWQMAETLSPKELEVAKMVSHGATNKMIARNMNITERTVKAHLTTIFQKMSLPDRLSLAIVFRDLR